jgi:hypothetical protein
MEKAVIWAVQKAVEDVDDSVAMAALLGAGLDSATFVALGVDSKTAVVAGAATGAGMKICKKLREGEKQ